MGLEPLRAYRVMCDFAGCEAACPGDMDDLHWHLAHAVKLGDVEARYEAENVATDAGWFEVGHRWFCPDHGGWAD